MGVKKRGAETEEPPFRGAILVSQNATVDGSDALLSRIVHGHCTRLHHSEETKVIARKLSGMSVEELGGWLQKALAHEKQLLSGYQRKFKELEENFSSRSTGTQSRLIMNHAQVAAWVWQLKTIFGNLISDEICREIQEHIWERCMDRQKRIGADHPLVALFWEQYEYLNFKTIYKDGVEQQIEILNHSSDQGLVAVNLSHFVEVSNKHTMDRLPITELKKILPQSRRYKFMEVKTIWSAAHKKSMKCWVFQYIKSGHES